MIKIIIFFSSFMFFSNLYAESLQDLVASELTNNKNKYFNKSVEDIFEIDIYYNVFTTAGKVFHPLSDVITGTYNDDNATRRSAITFKIKEYENPYIYEVDCKYCLDYLNVGRYEISDCKITNNEGNEGLNFFNKFVNTSEYPGVNISILVHYNR